MDDGAYMNILACYHSSVYQDSKVYLRSEIDLVEVDIRLVLDDNISSFIIYEIQPGIYNFKDLSVSVFNLLQPDNPESNSEIVFGFFDTTRKTKLFVRFGNIVIRFDGKSFFSTVLGFYGGLVI